MRLRVTTPATVANLGPGFDALALALEMRNDFALDTEELPSVSVQGEGAQELPEDSSNLVMRAMRALAASAGLELPACALACRNEVLVGRGLGSSATAIVGGLVLADRMLGTALGRARILRLAVDLESHADNVAACLLGGLTIAFEGWDGWTAERVEPHAALRPVLCIPASDRISTEEARRALPRDVPLSDAVANAARSALVVLALTERPGLLAEALEDRLHQSYRLAHMPTTGRAFEEQRAAGMPVCVAGSGPSLVVFETAGRPARAPTSGDWRIVRVPVARRGATLIEG